MAAGGDRESVYRNGETLGLTREQIDAAMGGGSQYGGGMGGGDSGGENPYGGNPYLDRMAQAMTSVANRNFKTQVLPAISSGAMQAGGYGGSRQGVIEANATNDFNQTLNNSLANLYGTDWTNEQNRGVQRYGMDQNYSLGLGGLSNQWDSNRNQFYTQQRGLDQTGAQIGAQMYGNGQNGQWSPITNAQNIYGNYTGFGNNTSSTSQGGGWQGAVGGGMAGAGYANQNRWW
jgi:hypothetical protein